MGRPLTAEDFRIQVETTAKEVTANVIGVIENQAPTKHLKVMVPVVGGEIKVDVANDIAKIALVERHKGTGGVEVGLVSGFGFTAPCGLATTVAHDSHHMIVVGTNEADMALAANKLAEINGGQVVVSNGAVIGLVELPIAGLMSTERAPKCSKKGGNGTGRFCEMWMHAEQSEYAVEFIGLGGDPGTADF